MTSLASTRKKTSDRINIQKKGSPLSEAGKAMKTSSKKGEVNPTPLKAVERHHVTCTDNESVSIRNKMMLLLSEGEVTNERKILRLGLMALDMLSKNEIMELYSRLEDVRPGPKQ